jgi:putative transposase
MRNDICENPGWGTRRIFGEIKKLGLSVSRSTLRRVMVDEGVLPDPDRRVPKGQPTPWRTFIDAHANVMVATDFFCKAVWSPVGKRIAYVLVFIHLGTRKVSISPATFHPTNEWVQQQARNALMWLDEENLDCQFVIHDHDTKFTKGFDQLFQQAGARTVDIPYEAPIANCYAESWIGSFKRECLNRLYVFNLRQLDYITRIYQRYHNELRPHQSLGNVPPGNVGQPPPSATGRVCRQRLLGGLLNHYERKAA